MREIGKKNQYESHADLIILYSVLIQIFFFYFIPFHSLQMNPKISKIFTVFSIY